MKKVNILLTLLSLNTVLVTIERFSFTTNVILQPYSFLRLHEVFQMLVVILLTVIIPFYLLKKVTKNFDVVKTQRGWALVVLYIIGIYLYATGNGVHEVASYLFNTFCDTKSISSTLCGSMFFNDYYFGNILYFIGLLIGNITLVLFERMNPNKTFTRSDRVITIANALVLALTMFAYAAYDRVVVGFVFIVIAAAIIDGLLVTAKVSYKYLPITMYFAVGYTVGTIASFVVRFL